MGLMCLTGALVMASAPSATASPAATTPRTASAVSMSTGEFETRLFHRINVRRVNHGCRTFRRNSALELAGQRHTDLMVADLELSHLLSGEASLGTRITQAGYTHWRRLAENLAWGQSSPRDVFRDWRHSAPHRANMDDCRLRDLGIAVDIRAGRPWVTADFGRRRVS